MANSNDTGTGGIEIDGKVYSMDVGLPDSQGGSQGPWSPGNINVDNSVKDITKPTKETFARYLSKSTLAQVGSSTHPNVYPVGTGETTSISNISLSAPDGTPMPLGETSNEKFFKKLNIGAPAPPGIKRGIASGQGDDGNTLLPNAATPGTAGGPYIKNAIGLNEPVKSYTDKALSKNLYNDVTNKFDDPAVAEKGQFFGTDSLHSTALLDENAVRIGGQDKGTFDQVISSPTSRELKKETFLSHAKSQIEGKVNVPGSIPNRYNPGLTANQNIEGETDPLFKDVSIVDEKGYPRSPTNDQSSEVFVAGFEDPNTLQSYKFAPGFVLPSSYSDVAKEVQLNSAIRRGKSSNAGPDGHTLLPNVAVRAPQSEEFIKTVKRTDNVVDKYTSAVLKKNRFNANNLQDPEAIRAAVSIITSQGLRGNTATTGLLAQGLAAGLDRPSPTGVPYDTFVAPDRLKFGVSPGTDSETPRTFNFDRLAQLGTLLQLRATGDLSGMVDGGSADPTATAEAGTLLPGIGQLGIPRSITDLDVGELLKNLTKNPVPENQYIDPNSSFEGVVNSVYEKFSGFTAFGMIALSASLVVVIIAAITGIAALLGAAQDEEAQNWFFGKPAKVDQKYYKGRHGIGSYQGGMPISMAANDIISMFMPGVDESGGKKILRFFGITPTVSNFTQAVTAGTAVFFGAQDIVGLATPTTATPGVAESVTAQMNPLSDGNSNNTTPALQNPGFYAILARAVVRSTVKITMAFQELGEIIAGAVTKAPSAGAAAATGGIISSIVQLVEIIETIRNSRLIAAIALFARLGDRLVMDATTAQVSAGSIEGSPTSTVHLQNVTVANLDAGMKISTIDAMYDNDPAATHVKSRLGTGKDTITKLAWSTNRTPDLFLIPKSKFNLAAVDEKLMSGRLITDDPLQKTKFAISEGKNRIPTALREKIERQFDSEYVPFYFHDLRTNEILGFHAFLNTLTDDYSANYESTEGIGRIEPVKVYKNTLRKLTFSFIIASTDRHDFESMWLKINKLVSMVYPQFGKGKPYVNPDNDGYRFEKPFTQSPMGAPMIRLRIGNVVASNYSKFNLAGIFGLFDPNDAKLNNQKYDSNIDLFNQVKSDTDEVEKLKKIRKAIKKVLNSTEAEMIMNVETDEAARRKLARKILIEYQADALKNEKSPDKATDKAVEQQLTELILNSNRNKYSNFDFRLKFKKEDLINSLEVISERLLTAEFAKKQSLAHYNKAKMYYDEMNNFLASETSSEENKTNAIVRSFKTMSGKGLAGFIDSINFDWLSGTTWDTDTNRKAPKMCKVSINFSPIHDITPGLDSMGHNRAPVYPVGVDARVPRGPVLPPPSKKVGSHVEEVSSTNRYSREVASVGDQPIAGLGGFGAKLVIGKDLDREIPGYNPDDHL
jgi:hypothetical protein